MFRRASGALLNTEELREFFRLGKFSQCSFDRDQEEQSGLLSDLNEGVV